MTTEQRITAALNNRNITVDALAELIVETESAIAAAEQAAKTERKRALDPLRSPDPAKARQAMEDAAFARDRLKTQLPRLQAKHRQVANAEEYLAWCSTFDPLLPRHTAAAAKLKQIYVEFADKLVEVLTEAKQIDAEVGAVMYQKPYHLWESNNDGRHLPSVESVARGVAAVNSEYSLMQLRLPSFDEPNKLAWPPHQTPLAVQVAASRVPIAADPRQYTARWHEVQAERAQLAREQAKREQQERQAEIEANYHGPRWWERTGS